jgi:hypothetical protein
MITMLPPSVTMTMPLPPSNTTFVFKVGKAIVACSPTAYRPATLVDPPEESELGTVYVYLRSKDSWVEIDLDATPAGEQIAQDIFVAYDRVTAELQDDRFDCQELY